MKTDGECIGDRPGTGGKFVAEGLSAEACGENFDAVGAGGQRSEIGGSFSEVESVLGVCASRFSQAASPRAADTATD